MHVIISCKNHMLCSKYITTFCLAEPLLIDTTTLELWQGNSTFFLDSLGLQTAQPITLGASSFAIIFKGNHSGYHCHCIHSLSQKTPYLHELAASVTITASGSIVCECHLRRLCTSIPRHEESMPPVQISAEIFIEPCEIVSFLHLCCCGKHPAYKTSSW